MGFINRLPFLRDDDFKEVKSNKKLRFDVQMSVEITEAFTQLAADCGMTRAEIFRRAIALYKHATDNALAGGKFIIRNEDGSEVEIVGLWAPLLKACMCGAQNSAVSIQQEHPKSKYATAVCPTCGQWSIEFRADYKEGDELQELANKAWNNAPRTTNNV